MLGSAIRDLTPIEVVGQGPGYISKNVEGMKPGKRCRDAALQAQTTVPGHHGDEHHPVGQSASPQVLKPASAPLSNEYIPEDPMKVAINDRSVT